MDPSSLQQHHQEIMESQSLDTMLVCTKVQTQLGQQQEKKPRPTDEAVKCPRCDSSNTKFCYYNNYSLSQPRYFCKSCRRYWTKGGTLRNVPVGGGCRKNNKRSSSSSSLSSSRTRSSTPDHHHLITTIPTSSPYDHHHDLTLAFARLQKQVGGSMGFDHHENHGNISLPNGDNTHFDLFGNSFIDPQHLYYGGGNSVIYQDHHHHHLDDNHQMDMQFDQQINQEMLSNASTPTTIKQELGENRVLWGLPWQINSGEGNYMNVPSWHSLLNSPLM